MYFNVNLNIHYTAPKDVWDRIAEIYREMPHWNGYVDGCPTWYGSDGKRIDASVEPSGLQFYAAGLSQEEWKEWLQLLKERASAELGYPIGEPEDGFEFKYWD